MENLKEMYLLYFATFSVFSVTTMPFVVQAWLEYWKPKTKLWKSIWSWIVPVALAMAAWGVGLFFKEGFLADLLWYQAAIYGAWAAVMANVAWDNVPWLKVIVGQFFVWLLNKTIK